MDAVWLTFMVATIICMKLMFRSIAVVTGLDQEHDAKGNTPVPRTPQHPCSSWKAQLEAQ